MTTPANDETKKDEVTTSAWGTTPKTTDAKDTSAAPKKRKRKRKPKKVVVSETNVDEAIKKDPTPPTPKKHEHEEKEETKKEEKHEESKKPNLDIKSDTHMLPGIDDIHDYIARKKATTHAHHKKEVLTSGSYLTPEGIDLLTLPGLLALIPHAKWDHKLVYFRTNEPTGLVDDPRNRTPGSMYVKNGRDIYMVTLTMKEHATLKDAHGEAYDVWIIDTLEQLTSQLDAIKNWMWWGENFWEPIFIEPKTTQNIDSNELLVSPTIGTDTSNTEHIHEVTNISEVTNIPTEADNNTAPTAETTLELASVEVNEPVLGSFTPTWGQDDISPLEINSEETTPFNLPDIDWEVDTDIGNIDSIDLTLPIDESIPDTALDVPEDTVTLSENKEQETNNEEYSWVSLDGIEVAEEQEGTFSPPESTEEVHTSLNLDNTSEEITLDMKKEESIPETDEWSTLHFTTPETGITHDAIPTEPLPEEPTNHALFWAVHEHNTPTATDSNELTNEITEQTSEKSMFTAPSVSPHQEINTHTESEIPEQQNDTPTEPMFSSQVTAPMTNESNLPTPDIQPESPLPSETIQQDVSFNLDDLSIESPEGTLDLDAMGQGDQPEVNQPEEAQKVVSSSTTTTSSSTPTSPKKSSFPIAIVIRIVLFLLIVGALFLVWKVMFPTIKWTKTPENNTTTGQQINDSTGSVDTEPQDDTTNPIDNADTTEPQDDVQPIGNTDIPTDTDEEINQPIDNTNNDVPTIDTPSSPPTAASLTLSELSEKLKVQQTDARKVLNIAKLLENKQAIKFALAAMLKAGNVLERIETEPTITAQDVLQESQKIDAYLSEANKLVE